MARKLIWVWVGGGGGGVVSEIHVSQRRKIHSLSRHSLLIWIILPAMIMIWMIFLAFLLSSKETCREYAWFLREEPGLVVHFTIFN